MTFAVIAALLATGCTPKKQEPANTVHLEVPSKIKGLDPVMADDLYSAGEVGKGYEGLLQYHYLKRPYTLIPNLAEAMPEISADGKTYTFKLKKGVLFHDDPCFKETSGKGRELTADDVVYSWKRLADPQNASPSAWLFDGKVAGFTEWHDEAAKAGSTDYVKPMEGLKALDRYTVQLKLAKKSYLLLYALAMPQTFIVPHEAVEMYGKGLSNHVVGTGPFRLVEFNGSLRVIWDRNPTYRHEVYPSDGQPGDKEAGLLDDAGQPLPRADRIVSNVFIESQPMWLSFLAGKLDASSIPKDNYSSAITKEKKISPDLASKGIQLLRSPQLDLTKTSFNMSDPILGKNKALRQALNLSYNDTEVVDLFYNGRAILAQGPIPPGLSGYDPEFKNPYRVLDVEKAKQLLAKAGYPGGKGLPALEYLTLSDSDSRQMTEYLQKAWDAIGVKLHVNTYTWPEFSASIKNRKGQIWSMGWAGDYPDAENFLALFYSKNASPGSNDMNYTNAEYDRLYEKALELPDSPARTEIYKQMVKILVEDCPAVFEAHREAWGLVQPWLKNYHANEVEYTRYKYFRVDPSLKK